MSASSGEILLRLCAQPRDAEALSELFQHLAARIAAVLKERVDSPDVEEAAQVRSVKLWERATLGGELPRDERSATAYVAKAARHAALDVLRRRRREGLHDGEEAALDLRSWAPDPAEELLAREQERIIDELRLAAREKRPERYRGAFDEQFDDALRLAGGDTTAELVLRRGLPSTDPGALKRARGASYTAQKRLRRELQATIDELVENRRWTPDDAELARAFVRGLFRCQKAADPDVPRVPDAGRRARRGVGS